MKRLILHVGPHKTGTTFLQKVFLENSEELRRQGVHYPKLFWTFLGQHHLPFQLQRETFRSFDDEISQIMALEGDVLLSSENFSTLGKVHLQKLKEIFDGYEIRVVFFVREPSSRLLSLWQTNVKHGLRESYFEYAADHYAHPFSSPLLNAERYLREVTEVFGPDALRLINYEFSTDSNTMLEDFRKATRLSFTLKEKKQGVIVNKMSELDEIEVIRALNIMAEKDKLLRGRNVQEAYRREESNEKELLASMKAIIRLGNKKVRVNGTLIDKLIVKELKKNFKEHFVNERHDVPKKAMLVPDSSWLLNIEAQHSLTRLYRKVVSNLES